MHQFNIIAEVSTACNHDISIRFRPEFIFVNTRKFKESNLSFCNQLNILNNNDFNTYPANIDGGAGLLASYYSKDNKVHAMPYTKCQNNWRKHFRLTSDYGIEFHNILYPNTVEFIEMRQKSLEYVNKMVYGNKQ